MTSPQVADVLLAAIQEAGCAVAAIAAGGFETRDKSSGGDSDPDPVTTADLEANRILQKALLGPFPDYGWFSEETRDDHARLRCRRVWIVDPVDGTREFVKGIPEYAVSVALVEDGQPILGAVHNPATGELYLAEEGKGVRSEGNPPDRGSPPEGQLSLVASRTETTKGRFRFLESEAEIRVVGSIAYKLGLVAAGGADGVISFTPKNEWDFAAGVILVREAGGEVTDLAGGRLSFNRPDPLVHGIIAAREAERPEVERLAALGADGPG